MEAAKKVAETNGEKYIRPNLTIDPEKGTGKVEPKAYDTFVTDAGLTPEVVANVRKADRDFLQAFAAESHRQSDTYFGANKGNSTVLTAVMGEGMTATASHTRSRTLPGGVTVTNSGVMKISVTGADGADPIREMLKGMTTQAAGEKPEAK